MKKLKLEIEQDSSPESPRTWDNLGTMVCFHKRYDLGDDNDYERKCSHNLTFISIRPQWNHNEYNWF